MNTRNGNVFTAIPIVSWSGRGPDMNMMLYHNSAAVGDTSFAQAVGFDLGPGWSIAYSDHLRFDIYPNPTRVTVVADDGTQNIFWWSSSQQRWVPPNGVYDKLSQDTEYPGIWKLKHKDLSFHEFSSSLWFRQGDGIARLTRVVDATGSAALLDYDSVGTYPQQKPRLKSVLAGGRYLNLDFLDWAGFESGFLQTIRDPWDGDESTHERRWTLQYYETDDYDEGWLSRIEDAMQHENRAGWNYFTYDTDGRLVTISDKCNTFPIGICTEANLSTPLTLRDKYRYTYTAEGRAYQVFDPLDDGGGRMQQFAFACSAPRPSERYTITNYTNRRGALWQYRYPEAAPIAVPANAGTLRFVQDPAGTSFYDFDGNFNLLRYADANGNFWDSTYDSNGNRLTLTDPLNHVQRWTYDWLNNVTSHIDAAGNIVWYYYDDPAYPTLLTRIVEPCNEAVVGGQPCPTDNPPGGQLPGQEGNFPVTRLTYYSNGQVESVIDPNGVWTGFEYDQWGQRSLYKEGRITPTSSPIYCLATTNDSSGVTIKSWTPCNGGGNVAGGDGGGSSTHDSNGNETSSTCIAVATGSVASTGFWPPFVLPCYPPNLPERSAEFFSATYGPRNELLTLPLDLDDRTLRTHTRAYDVMGRVKQAKVVSNEAGAGNVPRTFDYAYDVFNGRYTRTGPDGPGGVNGGQTVVQLDSADRVQYVERRASAGGMLLMRADYTHYPNDLVKSITYTKTDGSGLPGASIHYAYDAANRVTAIEHRNAVGLAMLRMDYTYKVNDLPETIEEWDQLNPVGQWSWRATTTFSYDRRSRLTSEYRSGQNAYRRAYFYDAGGNRTRKYDPPAGQETWYYYDWESPTAYGSNNNRLMYAELRDSQTLVVLSTTYYEYSGDGNVTRVITEYPPSGAVAAASSVEAQGATVGTTVEGAPEATALVAPGGGDPCEGLTTYKSVRLGYARNGRTVTFVHDESWCWDPVWACPANYTVTYAREFRYDGARARYMNRSLDPVQLMSNSLVDIGTVWTDYDHSDIYGDFTVTGSTATNTDKYVPGLWRSVSGISAYIHDDTLGTLRNTSNASGMSGVGHVFTAFGELLAGPKDRHGYAAAWGYQSHSDFQFLHVGHRYYDPSSGRFLQRDPIGIGGGSNVYSYVGGNPLTHVDPEGLFLDTLWDACNVAYDIWHGNWGDAAWDTAAMLVPFVPAGTTKVARPATSALRKAWSKLRGKDFPKDPTTGKPMDIHHKKPRADGGTDDAENLEPMPHDKHVDHHKKNGDFSRWGKRAHDR